MKTTPLKLCFALVGVAAVIVVIGMATGSEGFDVEALSVSWGSPSDSLAARIVWDIRLPRTLGALATGALLGVAGATAQGLFRNPLADPYLLGSAAGAALGMSVLVSVTGLGGGLFGAAAAWQPHAGGWFSRLGYSGAAFLGSSGAVLLTLALARGVSQPIRLLLCGVVVGVVLGACSSLVLLWSPQSLMVMQAFMLGSTAFLSWPAVALLTTVAGVCVAAGVLIGRPLDAMSLGEQTAQTLGIARMPVRLAAIALIALGTGTAVAQTGLIGFVGLAAPHVVRNLCRPKHGAMAVCAALMGVVLLGGSDVLARGALAPMEMPVGVLTAVLGGGYLLWLMRRRVELAGRVGL